MLRVYGVVGIALLVVWLFALFEAITSDAAGVRNLAKGFWILIILLTFEVGAVLWFIAGRPLPTGRPGGLPNKGNAGLPALPPVGGRRGAAVAPDDDPEFLRSLGRSQREHEQLLGQWEEDLRRREQRLRGDDEGGGADGTTGDKPPS